MSLALLFQLVVMGLVLWVVIEISEFFVKRFILGSKRPSDKDDSLPT